MMDDFRLNTTRLVQFFNERIQLEGGECCCKATDPGKAMYFYIK